MLRLARQHRRAALSLLAAMIIGGCADSATAPEGPQGEFVFSASVVGTTIATMVVEVTAPDITSPLAFNITITNGVATGTIKLPPGENRTITLRAFDNLGNETHEGSKTISVKPGQNPPVSIPVVSKAGQITITATMGPVAISVSPPTASVLVGATTQLTATITGPNGDVLSGPAAFATLNPSVASVDANGEVTGVAEGTVQIVATYAGVGAAATITVGPAAPVVLRLAVAGQTAVTVYDRNTFAQVSTYPLSEPAYSATYENGVIYAGALNKIFKVPTATGVIATIGSNGLAGYVNGLTVRNGILYAAYSNLFEVSTLSISGVSGAPVTPFPIGQNRGLAFGPNGFLYVVSTNGAFITRLAPDFLSQSNFPTGPTQGAVGLDVRSNGEVLVTSLFQSMYVVFSPAGAFLRQVQVNCTGELWDIAADPDGGVWVACPDQHAVVKFNSQDQEVGRIQNIPNARGLAVF